MGPPETSRNPIFQHFRACSRERPEPRHKHPPYIITLWGLRAASPYAWLRARLDGWAEERRQGGGGNRIQSFTGSFNGGWLRRLRG